MPPEVNPLAIKWSASWPITSSHDFDKAVVSDPADLSQKMRRRFLLDGSFGEAAQIQIVGILSDPARH